MPKDLPNGKACARAVAARQRTKAYSRTMEALANLRLARLIESFSKKFVVSGYLPIGKELSPVYAMCAAHHQGHSVCVPVVSGKGQPLRFRTWTPTSALERGSFGIDVPVDGDWIEPECLIVPVLAFDEDGFRLGYGGGFYDRTLAVFRADRQRDETTAIGIAFEAQQFKSVPVQPLDQRLDLLVTEMRTLRWT